jgi:hypothetical protein
MTDIASKAKISGTFYLLDPDAVLSLYERAGKDPDSDAEEKQPDYVEKIDGNHYLFTGWTVKRGNEEFEFVLKLGTEFTEAEIDSIDFMQLDEELEE